MILLKPPQPAHTECCLPQTNATCVTGQFLAHALLRASVRVTTQRSAVVTQTKSEPKCVSQRTFPKTRSTAPGIMVSITRYFFMLGTTNAIDLSILSTRNQFYPWPLRQSGNQGTSGLCNRCISESCDPSSISGSSIESVHLRRKNNLRVCSIQQMFVCFSLTSPVPDDCLWRLFCRAHFSQLRDCPAYFKGGAKHHDKERPCAGMLNCVGLPPYREYPRCLLTGIFRLNGSRVP